MHWYPATFLSAIPGTLIPALSRPGDLVLDPFSGSCTTGVEALRLGRRFLGIDANPIATLVGRAKLWLPTEADLIRHIRPAQLTALNQATTLLATHPNEAELLRWYHPTTYRELLFLLTFIGNIESRPIRLIAQAIFSSLLKNLSSQSRHWGWVCDNVIPRPGEINYKDALTAFQASVQAYLSATTALVQEIRYREGRAPRAELRGRWRLDCADANASLSSLPDSSVDLILTSPPYYGVADYVKSQRLSFLWFSEDALHVEGFGTGDFERLRRREIGSRSYRHGGDSLNSYLKYMTDFLILCFSILRPTGHVVLLLGESKARGATASALETAAIGCGFTKVFMRERAIKRTRRRLMAKVSSESLIVFRPT